MQRFTFTFFIALFALCSLLLFARQSGEGKLANILGKPALKEGVPLISFDRKKITEIQIIKGKEQIHIIKEGSLWMTKEEKRIDHRKVEKLLFLLKTAKVVKQIKSSKIALQKLNKESTEIKIKAQDNKSYILLLDEQLPRFTGLEAEYPTFTATLESGITYVCTSELSEQFVSRIAPNNLIDKHPFFFHPKLLREVTYNNDGSIFTLSRNNLESPWKVTSPLYLETDTDQVNLLIAKLYNLEANAVLDNITSLSNAEKIYPSSLAIKSFHQNFPDQVFGIKQEALYSKNGLTYQFDTGVIKTVVPSIDALRAKTITHLDLKAIDKIILQSNKQPYPLTLATQKNKTNQKPRWKFEERGVWKDADERAVADLFIALTQDKVKGFSLKTLTSNQESEKGITIIFKDNTEIHWDLFRSDSEILLQKKESNESTILTSTHAGKIKTRPVDWKEKKLWSFSSINLKGLQRRITGKPIENYSYNFNLEQWKGQIGAKTIDLEIDHVSANAYLEFLEKLTVLNWISPLNASLVDNTAEPTVQIVTLQENYNDEGYSVGMSHTSLELFPMEKNSNFFLTKLIKNDGGEEYCILGKATADALMKPITYKD